MCIRDRNILRGKKKEDPNKLAKSGFAGDSKAQQGDAQKKISESDSKLSEVSTETDTLSKDTNTLSTDFDDNISKGKDELIVLYEYSDISLSKISHGFPSSFSSLPFFITEMY